MDPTARSPSQSSPSAGSDARLVVECFTLGPYQTNCYLVHGAGDPRCWIIDASFDPDELVDRIRLQRLMPQAIVLTHAHVDHIAGLFDVREAFPAAPILIHEAEGAWLGDAELNLSAYSGMPVTGPPPDRLLRDGDELMLGESRWRVIHTPGHSPGGITLYCERAAVAFVGDALFAGSIGRTDFPGCSFETLEASIRRRLYTLPDNTRIFPGHGPESTIGHERRTNPFVSG